jgi:peptide/nickel transport system permease protein
LGFGIQPPTAAWGNMLSEGQDYMMTSWWLTVFPGLAIVITTLAVNIVGDTLRDKLDPKLRLR